MDILEALLWISICVSIMVATHKTENVYNEEIVKTLRDFKNEWNKND
jgi:hypothetical protein